MATTAPRCCGGGSPGPCPRTYASASARKQSRAARRKAQRKANKALGRLSSGPLMDEIRAAKLSKLSRAAAAPTTPRALRTAGGGRRRRAVAAARAPPATPLKRGTSLDALDAAWPAWGQEPELVATLEAPPFRSTGPTRLAQEPRPSTLEQAWASYVVAAAEAERARRIAVNDELDWANQLERERRQKWAAEAAQRGNVVESRRLRARDAGHALVRGSHRAEE